MKLIPGPNSETKDMTVESVKAACRAARSMRVERFLIRSPRPLTLKEINAVYQGPIMAVENELIERLNSDK